MYLLYGTVTATTLYFFYKVVKYLFYPKLKKFEDSSYRLEDEYVLLCYRIFYEDGTEDTVSDELTDEDFENMNETNKIKCVMIDYMFNNRIMKYITYNLNTNFPIYDVNVITNKNGRKLDRVLLNDIDVTMYVVPFLGPKDNFYLDKNVKINLEDLFYDHPDKDVLNFEEGNIKLFTNTGKEIEYELPWTPVFKPFSGEMDRTHQINNYVQKNVGDSVFGFTVIPN